MLMTTPLGICCYSPNLQMRGPRRRKWRQLRGTKPGSSGTGKQPPASDTDFVFGENGPWACAEKKMAQVRLLLLGLPDGLRHQAALPHRCRI